MRRPDFLSLPSRQDKPRSAGLTHVLDSGLPLEWIDPLMEPAGDYVDLWKLGWGTAYLQPDVQRKVAKLSEHGVSACVGGTLLEIAWKQGQEEAFFSWAAEAGFPCIEVSNGTVGMSRAEKTRLVEVASQRFMVLAEVGTKDVSAPVSGSAWAAELLGDLEAGAMFVLAEGRESGTVGLYEQDGTVREAMVEEIVGAVGLEKVIFEAPRKEQQAWFVNRFGPDVNLGNVPVDMVLGLETLRLGLRADTTALLSARRSPSVSP